MWEPWKIGEVNPRSPFCPEILLSFKNMEMNMDCILPVAVIKLQAKSFKI